MELKYGVDYPDACPPACAIPIEGYFYRLCDNNPPTEHDFKTHVDLKIKFPPKRLCEAKALSFLKDKESADKFKKRFPKFKDKKIVSVHIKVEYGISSAVDRNGHFNFWEYEQAKFLEA